MESRDLQYFSYYSFIFQTTDKPITCCFNNHNNRQLRMKAHSSALFFCTEYREANWRVAYLMLTGFTSLTPIALTFHISSAYCLMVLSLENLPEDATFKIAMLNQWSGSWTKTSKPLFKKHSTGLKKMSRENSPYIHNLPLMNLHHIYRFKVFSDLTSESTFSHNLGSSHHHKECLQYVTVSYLGIEKSDCLLVTENWCTTRHLK